MHTAISNAYEKEIEMLLSQANATIVKQKEALNKANEQGQLKERIAELESQHIEERQQTQKDFAEYQQAIKNKEDKMEKDHQEKYQN